jgi:hypothetical protein
MATFALGSKPMIELTLRSYEMNLAALMIYRSISKDPKVIADATSEIQQLESLIEQTTEILKRF